MPPQSRRTQLKIRVKHFVRMLTHGDDNKFGLNRATLASEMTKTLGRIGAADNIDPYMAILNYRKGQRVPEATYAWALGEALRTMNVRWANGFCMLWAAGAYESALSTTFEYVVQRNNEPDAAEVQMLWSSALYGMQMPALTSIYDFEEALIKHLLNDVGSTPEIDTLLESKIGNVDESYSTSPNFDGDAYERRVQTQVIASRELAMKLWHETVPYIERLEIAFKAACVAPACDYEPRHGDVQNDPWGQLGGGDMQATVALDLARASRIPLSSLESGILIVLGEYLNSLDPDRYAGGRSMNHLPR